MKYLGLLILLLATPFSCKKSDRDLSPPDPLYQPWQPIETRSNNESWKPYTGSGVLALQADGTIQFTTSRPGCCSPVRFERQNQLLQFTDYYSGAGCEYVDCASPAAARIVSLSLDELILEYLYGTASPVSSYFIKYTVTK